MWDDNSGGREGSFARDVMEQFAERLAERQDFSRSSAVKSGLRRPQLPPSG